MELVERWLALGLGVFTLSNSLLRSRAQLRLPRIALPFLAAAVLLVVLAALCTLPTKEPFSPGQTLAPGLVLGALSVLIGMLSGPWRESEVTGAGDALKWSGRIGSAACGAAVLTLLYSSRILDALSGFALGALCVGLVVGGGLTLAAANRSDGEEAAVGLARGAEATALTVVALASAVYLATLHRSPSGAREWQALPSLLAASAALLMAARSAVATVKERAWVYDLLLIPIPLLVIGWLISVQLQGTHAFLKVITVGIAVFGMVGWLDRVAAARGEEAKGIPRLDLALITGLLVLGGAVLVFREISGYGLAIMTLSGVLVTGAAASPDSSRAATGRLYLNAILLGVLLTLYRVYTERNEYSRGFQPDFLYYYVALTVGAMLPGLLAGVSEGTMVAKRVQGSGNGSTPSLGFSALARVLLVAAISVAAPLAVWLLIGDRPQSALLVGLAVGAVLLGTGERSGEAFLPIWRMSAALIAITAVQFTHLLEPLALRTRGQRLGVLALVAAVALVAIAFTAWREARLRSRTVN